MPHLPSPSSTASLSPRHSLSHSHGMARHGSCSDDDSDQAAARSALEIRREKNRIKQRNLRLRRANQMADLETTNASLRSKAHDLEDRMAVLEAHEASLSAWVRELETALINHGHREHVDTLRRVWSASAGVSLPPPVDHHHGATSRGDPLATLASAASSASSYRSQRRWEDDEDRTAKRRRHDDESYPMHPPASRDRLTSPSRMRIAELVLPLPHPTSTPAPAQPQAWSWGQLPSIEYATPGYEHKSRLPAVVDARDPSPTAAERRPPSSSSSGTRTWASPVQSFEIRL